MVNGIYRVAKHIYRTIKQAVLDKCVWYKRKNKREITFIFLSSHMHVFLSPAESSLLFLFWRWHRWGKFPHPHTTITSSFPSPCVSRLFGLYAYVPSRTQRGCAHCYSSDRLRMVRKYWSANTDDVTVTRRLVWHSEVGPAMKWDYG